MAVKEMNGKVYCLDCIALIYIYIYEQFEVVFG